ncbi:hypothetical protein POTOM_037920 [Populus tomentosa]|uniref:Uncharacterized protein n=1 Tax=Populus tomentosa TaxID=118781 RepID=A0A8X7YXP6_POPTO|nr:hypothetical protein POTOM_037920 [Populus tomentosa]
MRIFLLLEILLLVNNMRIQNGYPSADSSIFCSPPPQSPSVEAFLDPFLVCLDLCYAHKPEGDGWHGPPKACQLVRRKVPKEEKTYSQRLILIKETDLITHKDLMRFCITWMEKASIGNRWRRLVPVAGNVTVN